MSEKYEKLESNLADYKKQIQTLEDEKSEFEISLNKLDGKLA